MLFSTINRNPKAWLLAIFGAEYILSLLPKGTHEYERFIRPSELRSWGTQTGLQWQHVAGIEYAPLRKQFSISSNIDVNYIMHFSAPE